MSELLISSGIVMLTQRTCRTGGFAPTPSTRACTYRAQLKEAEPSLERTGSPAYPIASITTVSSKSFLKQSAVTGLCAALRMSELKPILLNCATLPREDQAHCVSDCEHHRGAEAEFPEALGGGWALRCLENEVEFNHQRWHRDAPINIPAEMVNLRPCTQYSRMYV